MLIRLKRLELLLVNFIFLIILFFVMRMVLGTWIMSQILHIEDSSLFNQFWLKIKAGLVFLGIFVIVANILTITGLFFSKHNNSKELTLGFKYTLYLTATLVILYIALLIYFFTN